MIMTYCWHTPWLAGSLTLSILLADAQLSGTLWLAELGKPQTIWVYYMIDNHLDVLKTAVGIGRRLGWKCSEKELALYYGEHISGLSCMHKSTPPHLICSCFPFTCQCICCLCNKTESHPNCSGPDSHFSEPLEICPIVGGQVKVINLYALNGRGRQHTSPLGVASGAVPSV